MNDTIKYYNNNSNDYFNSTVYADMHEHYNQFLSYLNKGDTIVDAGCGSGRDTKYFKELGYDVIAYDASVEMVEKAKEYTGINVKCCTFMDDGCINNSVNAYWACASLLHLKKEELVNAIKHFYDSLVNSGIVYASFKYGNNNYIDEKGRYFELINEDDFSLFESVGFKVDKSWISEDKTGRSVKWINIILRKL